MLNMSSIESAVVMLLIIDIAFYEAYMMFRLALYIEITKQLRKYSKEENSREVQSIIETNQGQKKDYVLTDEERKKILYPLHSSSVTSYPKEGLLKDEKRIQSELAKLRQEMPYPEETTTNSNISNMVMEPSVVNDDVLRISLKKLDNLVGLKNVKKMVFQIKDFLEVEKIREKNGQKASNPTLHMIFTGNPGTGKTTVARIIADIFRSLGFLSKGHLVEVSREDLVGGYVGQTAEKTKKIIEQAKGGILFIDEAYTLSRGGEQDFGKEAIDTLVKGMEDLRNDLVIILAGYTKEMEEFMKKNSGLYSRFPYNIEFADYTGDELLEILNRMVKEKGFMWEKETRIKVKGKLEKMNVRGKNDTGNGRMIRNVLEAAIIQQSHRLKKEGNYQKSRLFELQAIDFDIKDESAFDLDKELSSVIGNEEVKHYIRMIQAQIQMNQLREKNGLVSQALNYHMIFKGNPGTGKTMIARLMANLLKQMGVVKTGHLVEVGREDLVAGFVGQTAIKTKEIINKALGGVLFIDEAYSLVDGGENDFGKEAINTLIKEMEDHRDELVVILAGYSEDMARFMQVNAGIQSRFPFIFEFKDYDVNELIEIFRLMVKEKGYVLEQKVIPSLQKYFCEYLTDHVNGNARMVRNLLEKAIQKQSYRLSQKNISQITKEELEQIKLEDLSIPVYAHA